MEGRFAINPAPTGPVASAAPTIAMDPANLPPPIGNRPPQHVRVELEAVELDVPGRYLLVDHALSRLERGLVGFLMVEGEPNEGAPPRPRSVHAEPGSPPGAGPLARPPRPR